jgi:hypothetical protein
VLVGQSEATTELLQSFAPGERGQSFFAQLFDQNVSALLAIHPLLRMFLEFQGPKFQNAFGPDSFGLFVP